MGSTGVPELRHHQRDREAIDGITASTPVRRRPPRITMDTTGEAISLQYNGKATRVAFTLAEQAAFILEREGSFTAADLPGDLDEAARLKLIRALVRDGLLTLH
jgi:hypothetical protein